MPFKKLAVDRFKNLTIIVAGVAAWLPEVFERLAGNLYKFKSAGGNNIEDIDVVTAVGVPDVVVRCTKAN